MEVFAMDLQMSLIPMHCRFSVETKGTSCADHIRSVAQLLAQAMRTAGIFICVNAMGNCGRAGGVNNPTNRLHRAAIVEEGVREPVEAVATVYMTGASEWGQESG